MNKIKNKFSEHFKTLTPLSSALIKLYIPILATLLMAIGIVGCIYLGTDLPRLHAVILDCVQAAKNTFGIALLMMIITKAAGY